jgi:CubicO group peptidase (beta-lactamase class C family)
MRLRAFFHIGAVAASTVSIATDDVLHFGSPESVDMDPKALDRMVSNLTAFTEARNWGDATDDQVLPIEPGGATLVARHGVIVSYFAFGKRSLWAGVNGTQGVKLPEHDQEDASVDTIYDAASLTKMYTTVAALRCIDQGLFTLNGTVASWLPEFGVNGKENITVLQLMTHTSGFPASPSPLLYLPIFPTYESRIDAILGHGLQNVPGEAYVYSDLSYMSLMLLIEKVTKRPLDEVIGDITRKLGANDTFFNKGNKEGGFDRYKRIAPTEFQRIVVGDQTPDRPQPCKTVHDEQAWSLNGVSGHAGIFTTLLDTAHLAEMIRRNGTYNGHRILSQESVDAIFTNWNAGLGPGRGAGFELNQTSTAGPMASELTASHTGFTGTSMVIDRATDTIFLHFANRVHPSREWSSNTIVRKTLGAWVATSLGKEVVFP